MHIVFLNRPSWIHSILYSGFASSFKNRCIYIWIRNESVSSAFQRLDGLSFLLVFLVSCLWLDRVGLFLRNGLDVRNVVAVNSISI